MFTVSESNMGLQDWDHWDGRVDISSDEIS